MCKCTGGRGLARDHDGRAFLSSGRPAVQTLVNMLFGWFFCSPIYSIRQRNTRRALGTAPWYLVCLLGHALYGGFSLHVGTATKWWLLWRFVPGFTWFAFLDSKPISPCYTRYFGGVFFFLYISLRCAWELWGVVTTRSFAYLKWRQLTEFSLSSSA